MVWYRDLYLSDDLRDQEGVLRDEIERGVCRHRLWAVIVSPNGQDLLEIRRAASLTRHDPGTMIVGLSSRREEAAGLVHRIVSDSIRAGKDVDLRGYLDR